MHLLTHPLLIGHPDPLSPKTRKRSENSMEMTMTDQHSHEKIIDLCPICDGPMTTATAPLPDGHPYAQCRVCGLLRQPNPPEKRYEGPAESRGDEMTDRDKAVNATLATRLLGWIDDDVREPSVLDVGSKYPYLLHCMKAQRPTVKTLAVDGIPEVVEFGRALGVNAVCMDIESDPSFRIFVGQRTYDLITLVHVAEHFYNLLGTMTRLADSLSSSGTLFLRSPTWDVSGIERHMSPHHYTIHPTCFSRESVRRLAEHAGLVVVSEVPMDGAGQTDFVLRRPEVLRQTIGVGMIVRNEERDLPEALESAVSFANAFYIVDTGSTDSTRQVVQHFALKHDLTFHEILDGVTHPSGTGWVAFHPYFDASEMSETGEWRLNSFSKARNVFVKALDSLVDWVFWLDADDVIGTPERVRSLIALDGDAFNFNIVDRFESPATSFAHMRLWRTGRGTVYKGACHEYPYLPEKQRVHSSGLQILHRWEPHTTAEKSETRNLRILKREYADGARDPRTLFYLANSYRDCQAWDDAIAVYREYLELDEGWHDEKVFAHLYLSRCLRFAGRQKDSIPVCYQGLALDTRFSEIWMELAYAYFDLDSEKCLSMCTAAMQPLPPSPLFLERNKYEDQPWRIIGAYHQRHGNTAAAILATQNVLKLVPGDAEMQALLSTLTGGTSAPAASKPELHLLRPGAAGDVLCILQNIPALRRANPGKRIILHTNPAFMDLARCCTELDDVQPDVGCPAGTVSLIGYPLKDGWPNVTMWQHLGKYFAAEMGVEPSFVPIQLNLPSIADIRANGLPDRYVTLHPKAGWSPYKEWPFSRWAEIVAKLFDLGINVVQIGGPHDPPVKLAHQFRDLTFPQSLAVLKGAAFHLGIDSWSNHGTSVFPLTPSVILFGSTWPQEFGYGHNRNISRAMLCQPCHREYPQMSAHPKPPCLFDVEAAWTNDRHPCMSAITVDEVWLHVQSLVAGYWR